MSAALWNRLALVFAAGGMAVLCALLAGTLFVPLFVRRTFVSRETKEGVAQGRSDVVPMGGGFILLTAVSVVVLTFWYWDQIRAGYAGCFLIAFWGFGLLGFLDDCSKVARHGYSDQLKLLLQLTVSFVFAVAFYIYALRFVPDLEVGLLTLPFVGDVSLGPFYVPFAMAFLFYVSNAVNITDGFNGLAGGTGAVVALGFAVVTFLIGAHELQQAALRGLTDTHTIAPRMFALSLMSAGLAGSLVGYLYFNFHRGSIYFGDTGSMALGASLAFLALFSRTEFLMLVIGGVYFAEAGSVFLQKLWIAGCNRLVDPLMLARMEPTRPFVIAPLHHHFEHLVLRELEEAGDDRGAHRPRVRRRLTLLAWTWGLVFALIGVFAQYGRYRGDQSLFNWLCVLGVLAIGVLLGAGVFTRFLYDCYFIGPDETGATLTLYRGVPLRCGRRLFARYQPTDIPLSALGYLEQRTGLFRLFFSRVDARTAFGLLHFGCAEQAEGSTRRRHLEQALSFWSQVPRNRFLVAARHDVLAHMATCYRELGRPAQAVACLEELYAGTNRADAVAQIEAMSQEALTAAEQAWSRWQARTSEREDLLRADALHCHEELLRLMTFRYERARRVLERLPRDADRRDAVERQVKTLAEALPLVDDRCRQLAGGRA